MQFYFWHAFPPSFYIFFLVILSDLMEINIALGIKMIALAKQTLQHVIFRLMFVMSSYFLCSHIDSHKLSPSWRGGDLMSSSMKMKCLPIASMDCRMLNSGSNNSLPAMPPGTKLAHNTWSHLLYNASKKKWLRYVGSSFVDKMLNSDSVYGIEVP